MLNEFIDSVKTQKHRKTRHLRIGWRDGVIALLWLLLWTTNRRRVKPDLELSDRAEPDRMVESFAGITEGSIDRGNRVEILQNGAYFDRLLEDIAAARTSIHIETYVWWTGDVCDGQPSGAGPARRGGRR